MRGLNKRKGKKLGQCLSILPSGGGVSEIPANLCLANLFPSELVGAWICFHGDGTSHNVSTTGIFTVSGAPVTQSVPTNNNRSNMAPTTGQRFNGSSDFYQTANVTAPSGSMSAFAVFSTKSSAGFPIFALDITSTGANRSFLMYANVTGAGSLDVVVFKDNSTFSNMYTASQITPKVRHTGAFTYKYVADTTSELRSYCDGISVGTPILTARGPIQPGGLAPIHLGRSIPDGIYANGMIYAALITEKELAPATIQAMSNVALGTWSGSFGEAITFTRNSIATVTSANGQSVCKVKLNRPCFVNGGVVNEAAATNLYLQSEAIATGTTTAFFGTAVDPVRTNNYAIAPDGTMSATRVILDRGAGNTSGDYCRIIQQVAVSNSTAYASSFWAKTTDGSTKQVSWRDDIANAGIVNQVLTFTGTWQRFTSTSTSTGTTSNQSIWNRGTITADNYVDLLIWGWQLETGAYNSSYIPTEGTSIGRIKVVGSTAASSWPTVTGNVYLSVVPLSVLPGAGYHILDCRSGVDGFRAYIGWNSGDGQIVLQTQNSGGNTITRSGSLSWVVGTTYNLQFIWNSGKVYVYRDGVLVASDVTGTAYMPAAYGTLYLGSDNASNSQFLGRLFNCRIGKR